MKNIPVLFETDVLVVGGGAAGMCAAVAAARTGARTAIVERWPVLGGQATMAHVNMWHTSDRTREVILGLTRELVERLETYDAVKKLPGFPSTHETYEFFPDLLVLVYEDLVRELKIRTLCSTLCVDVVTEESKISGVVIGTKMGLRQIQAKYFIDATGDGDVGFFAGCETETGRPEDGRCQGMTLVAAFSGLDPARRDEILKNHTGMMTQIDKLFEEGKLPAHGPHWFGGNFVWRWGGTLLACASGNPLDAENLTQAGIDARSKLPVYLNYFRENVRGCENLEIQQIANWLGIRESRRVRGLYTFTGEDILTHRRFDDAIGHGFWMVDVHDPAGTGHTTWYNEQQRPEMGTTYQIAYRMLVARDVKNLFVAGRCASATHAGMAGLRVQSHCHVMGQAAGTAAALCLSAGLLPKNLEMAKLQQQLVRDGVFLEVETA